MSWFNAADHDPTKAFSGGSPLPVGKYAIGIYATEQKATGDGNNGMLLVSCEVLDGEHKGARGSVNFNLWHSNPQTAEIAGKQLSALCTVTNTPHLVATQPHGAELIGKTCRIEIAKQGPESKYVQMVGLWDMNGGTAQKMQPQQQPGQGPAPQQFGGQAGPQPAPYQPQGQVQPAAQPPANPWPGAAAPQPQQQPAYQAAYQPPAAAPQGQPAAPNWAQGPQGGQAGGQAPWGQR